ncbi:alpha-ketoglutarate-dependent dioxygenase AlkB [Photobacterium sp. CCB-ST2H9]|uniref:alpha-ketoglutarate-dependent dioxygenase AlkB family protein n=1 Tax=Photobacterium sp. CCB-ST2H9 TaxID=2912855 RepID=UPI0020034277|nr:alpha-ketoglutarate-dependent dioxygenase AlkB [Photobacterium sp. CCB-ST2H9]UTM58308.1 alpha-ketoglutarate-dependent dioxygenase AlkB [Photobacterium sp. CCB-ST2H9]
MMNLDLFTPAPSQGEWIEIDGGRLYWAPAFFELTESDRYFAALRQSLHWKQEAIALYGRQVLQPRLQSWCGEAQYSYSGLTMQPEPWTPELLAIKMACETACQSQFNSVLANLYRNGQDSMGWHQDNEPELGPQPVIASVTFGESRRFLLKHKRTAEKIEFQLGHGSLLVMAGQTQSNWAHSVPKTQQHSGERINLTYRWIYHV